MGRLSKGKWYSTTRGTRNGNNPLAFGRFMNSSTFIAVSRDRTQMEGGQGIGSTRGHGTQSS